MELDCFRTLETAYEWNQDSGRWIDRVLRDLQAAEGLQRLGQDEGEPGTATGTIVIGDHTPPMRLDDGSGYGQPHAHPAILGGEKALEDAIHRFLGNSRARILDRTSNLRTLDGRPYDDLTPT